MNGGEERVIWKSFEKKNLIRAIIIFNSFQVSEQRPKDGKKENQRKTQWDKNTIFVTATKKYLVFQRSHPVVKATGVLKPIAIFKPENPQYTVVENQQV